MNNSKKLIFIFLLCLFALLSFNCNERQPIVNFKVLESDVSYAAGNEKLIITLPITTRGGKIIIFAKLANTIDGAAQTSHNIVKLYIDGLEVDESYEWANPQETRETTILTYTSDLVAGPHTFEIKAETERGSRIALKGPSKTRITVVEY